MGRQRPGALETSLYHRIPDRIVRILEHGETGVESAVDVTSSKLFLHRPGSEPHVLLNRCVRIAELQVVNPGVVLHQHLHAAVSSVHDADRHDTSNFYSHSCVHEENLLHNLCILVGIRQRLLQPRLRNIISDDIRTLHPFSGRSCCGRFSIFSDACHVLHQHHYTTFGQDSDHQKSLVFLVKIWDPRVSRNLFAVVVPFYLRSQSL